MDRPLQRDVTLLSCSGAKGQRISIRAIKVKAYWLYMHPSKQKEKLRQAENAPSQLKSNFLRHLKRESNTKSRKVYYKKKVPYSKCIWRSDWKWIRETNKSFDNKVYLFPLVSDLILTLFYTAYLLKTW